MKRGFVTTHTSNHTTSWAKRAWTTYPCSVGDSDKKLEAAWISDLGEKAATFSMIPKDPQECLSLGSTTWRSHRTLTVVTSRDSGTATSCCFTLQPITALDYNFLLSHWTGEWKSSQGMLSVNSESATKHSARREVENFPNSTGHWNRSAGCRQVVPKSGIITQLPPVSSSSDARTA